MRKLANWLYQFSGKLPCRIIDRGQNEPYLERYWVGSRHGVTAYLHRFVASDADKWVHDHPWTWAFAIILVGGYLEERVTEMDVELGWLSKHVLYGGWRRLNIIRGRDFHRILKTRPETWTLFVHGSRKRRESPVPGRNKVWGFFERTKDGVRYHQPYDVSIVADWQNNAPSGSLADRQPFLWGHHAKS